MKIPRHQPEYGGSSWRVSFLSSPFLSFLKVLSDNVMPGYDAGLSLLWYIRYMRCFMRAMLRFFICKKIALLVHLVISPRVTVPIFFNFVRNDFLTKHKIMTFSRSPCPFFPHFVRNDFLIKHELMRKWAKLTSSWSVPRQSITKIQFKEREQPPVEKSYADLDKVLSELFRPLVKNYLLLFLVVFSSFKVIPSLQKIDYQW